MTQPQRLPTRQKDVVPLRIEERRPGALTRVNDSAKSKVLALQEYFILAGKALRFIFARPFYAQDTVQQMDEIGVKSLGIVLLTGLFTGMVLALQSSVQLKTFGATIYIGRLVSASMIRELGPVLAGLMVAGRVGSGIAAQLGSMRVTEQIDALTSMGRAQGWVVGLLPIFIGFVLYQQQPERMSLLFTQWYGWIVLAVVAVMMSIAAWMIRKIVNIDV